MVRDWEEEQELLKGGLWYLSAGTKLPEGKDHVAKAEGRNQKARWLISSCFLPQSTLRSLTELSGQHGSLTLVGPGRPWLQDWEAWVFATRC